MVMHSVAILTDGGGDFGIPALYIQRHPKFSKFGGKKKNMELSMQPTCATAGNTPEVKHAVTDRCKWETSLQFYRYNFKQRIIM